MTVSVDDITGIFPRELEPDEIDRVEKLLTAADELIEEAFLRRGRDFFVEVNGNRLLQLTHKRVVREMISEAVLVGENVGRVSANSTTGPQSDAVTWSQGIGIHWGGVYLTDEWLKDLGLGGNGRTKGNFGRVVAYRDPANPRTQRGGAEFSERRGW